MIEVSSVKELKEAGFNKIAVACGNFDGLHRGHQEIINTLLKVSDQNQSIPVVLTFKPHPREVLTGKKVPSLTAHYIKLRLLEEMGVRALITVPFSKEFASKSADEFISEILLADDMKVTDLCIGSQWRFGKGREGNVDFLKSRDFGFAVHGIEEVSLNGDLISSSRIRKSLATGNFSDAEALLGREYSVYGPVTKGRGIATSELKFPTANIETYEQYLPLAGVFACKVSYKNEWLSAVSNIGHAPTFGADLPARVEVHLLDFNEDLYGQNLEVAFVSFIRNEKKFESIELLKQQIAKDVEKAREIFKI